MSLRIPIRVNSIQRDCWGFTGIARIQECATLTSTDYNKTFTFLSVCSSFISEAWCPVVSVCSSLITNQAAGLRVAVEPRAQRLPGRNLKRCPYSSCPAGGAGLARPRLRSALVVRRRRARSLAPFSLLARSNPAPVVAAGDSARSLPGGRGPRSVA